MTAFSFLCSWVLVLICIFCCIDVFSESIDDELDEWLKVQAPPNHVNILPEEQENDTHIFRGRQSSFDFISNMWENFSVNDYAPIDGKKKRKRAWIACLPSPSLKLSIWLCAMKRRIRWNQKECCNMSKKSWRSRITKACCSSPHTSLHIFTTVWSA